MNIDIDDKRLMLSYAKESIEHGFLHDAPAFRNPRDVPDRLKQPMCTFVTLKAGNVYKGCIGNPLNQKPLFESVYNNAFFAAFRDTRFPKLQRSMLSTIGIEISFLTVTNSWKSCSLDTIVAAIKPNTTLTLSLGDRRATMLSSTQSTFKTLNDFVLQTRSKANLQHIPFEELVVSYTDTEHSDYILYKDIPCPNIS